MNAKLARAISEKVNKSKIFKDKERHELVLKKILNEIKKEAKRGQTSMLFAPEVEYVSEREMYKRSLEELGYSFSEESDMQLKYTLIHW